MSNPCPPFDPEIESISEFVERFKIFNSDSLQKAGTDEQKKAAIFIKCLPVSVITDLQRRMKPTKLSEATYDAVLQKITSQFQVKKSLVGASVQFLNRKQQPSETIESYAKILNDLAASCEYSDCCRDRLLRDAFISGLQSSAILRAVLPECDNKSFNECVDKAKLLEQLTCDAQDMQPAGSFQVSAQRSHGNAHAQTFPNAPKLVPPTYICIRCSAAGKHSSRYCPCINMKCNICSKKGHIAKACRSQKAPANFVQEESLRQQELAHPSSGPIGEPTAVTSHTRHYYGNVTRDSATSSAVPCNCISNVCAQEHFLA